MGRKPMTTALYMNIALSLTLITALCLTGCTTVLPTGRGSSQADASPGNVQEGNTLSETIKIPSEYLITYEVENDHGTLYQISGGKDAEGRIYFKRQVDELLFVPTNGGYLQYSVDPNGLLVQPAAQVYTQAYVEDLMHGFLEYAQKYTLYQEAVAEYSDKTTIAGRSCKTYEVVATTAAISQKYTFATDDETGICMEWRYASEIMNHSLPTEIGFKCTEFVTMDVKLPVPE